MKLQIHIPAIMLVVLFNLALNYKLFGNNYSNDILDQIPITNKPAIKNDNLNTFNRSDTIVWMDTIKESSRVVVLKNTKIDIYPVQTDTFEIINLKLKDSKKIESKPKIQKPFYNIALIQPFLTDLFEEREGVEIPVQSLKAVEFYEGVKLALKNLEDDGLKLNLHVFDSKRELSTIDNIIVELDKKEWDLIIGPNSTDGLSLLLEYGKKKQIPVLSVYNNNQNISNSGDYYIQLNPGYKTESAYIVKLLQGLQDENKYNLERVNYLLLGMSEDSLKINEIDNFWKNSKQSTNSLPKLISSENVNISNIQKYFDKDALNVVVIPSDRSETFVFSCLREMSSLYDKLESKNSYRFLVVGTSMWKYFERVNFEYYNNLNLHIVDDIYIDKSSTQVVEFENLYKREYGIIPREFAYIGYDAVTYFGKLFKKHGTAFYDNLDKEKWKGYHNSFDFKAIIKTQRTPEGEEINYIRGYENTHLNVLKVKNYEIIPANYSFIKD